MRIGVPREIKAHEYRVGLTPAAVADLVAHGHALLVETGAGAAIDFTDADYSAAGARILSGAEEVYRGSELLVKVKEPMAHEMAWLSPEQTLFAYLHLAADRPQAEQLINSGVTAIGYETVTDARGALPLLRPMSEVAGRMSVQVGAHYLEKHQGGRGVLLSGVPGVPSANVVVLGGGVSGYNAALAALGMRANVTVLDISTSRLGEIDQLFAGRVETVYASSTAIAESVAKADLVIGAVLTPGAATPKLVSRQMVQAMQRGTVVVDIAIDQGGCFETSRPTTHDNPVYVEEGVIHYCVSNMPGAVARTSTLALVNATLPFVMRLADLGCDKAIAGDIHLANGLNVQAGTITHAGVASALAGLPTSLVR